MLWLYVQAPFAACRTFTAGWYRPTASFLTPSAAYGFVLNLAGIESRLREGEVGHDGKTPTTLTRPDLPAMTLALGAPARNRDGGGVPFDAAFPRLQSVYQQLHNYPVGVSGKERAEECKANKYNITPVRREFLTDLRVLVVIKDAESAFIDRLHRGLAGSLPRYGLPFLGDNNFLPDRVEVCSDPVECYWYELVLDSVSGPQPRTTRLTVRIDRADSSRTTSYLYAPSESASALPNESAWTQVGPLPARG
jgi:CRISPR-associated protein Cas5t